MIIYIVLYRNNNFHNDQMKDSLSKRNLHARYRQKDYSEALHICKEANNNIDIKSREEIHQGA